MANLDASYADGDSLWSLQQHGYVPKALSTHLMVVCEGGFMWVCRGCGGGRANKFRKNLCVADVIDLWLTKLAESEEFLVRVLYMHE